MTSQKASGRIVESLDGFKWYVEEGDDFLVLNDGEMAVREVLYRLAKKERVFVDVGAHVGEYAIRMAKVYGKVEAFEPNPRSASLLAKNVELNGVDNITIHQVACGDAPGELILYARGGSTTPLKIEKHSGIIRAKVVRLDDYLSRVDVVKIDVEGWEERVVRGMSRLIRDCRPFVVVEHHEYRGYEECRGMRQRIRSLFPDYYALNLNNVHWLYAPRECDLEEISLAIALHWINKALKNIQEGRPWYYGFPLTWWYGADVTDLFLALPRHVTREREWIELLER